MGACTMWLSQNLGWFLCLDFLWELVRHDLSRSFWGPPSEKDKTTYPKDPKQTGFEANPYIPYIGLIYSRYLRFRSLKWPLTKTNYQTGPWQALEYFECLPSDASPKSRSLGLSANQQTMDPRWYDMENHHFDEVNHGKSSIFHQLCQLWPEVTQNTKHKGSNLLAMSDIIAPWDDVTELLLKW